MREDRVFLSAGGRIGLAAGRSVRWWAWPGRRAARLLCRPAPGRRRRREVARRLNQARALAAGVRLVAADASCATSSGVASPGVPPMAPNAPARRRGAVIGELEPRASDAEGAHHGDNGKTDHSLTGPCARQGRTVLVAGHQRAEAACVSANGWLVLEVSSFQLETIATFRPRVAAVLNVSPDHLDRHRTLAAYTAAKARIFENQGPGDLAVLNEDDAGARALAGAVRTDLVWFSRRRELPRGVFVREGWIVAHLDGAPEPICPLGEIALRGAHNVENALAATACARWLGVPAALVREGSRPSRGGALDRARPRLDGVAYYNDWRHQCRIDLRAIGASASRRADRRGKGRARLLALARAAGTGRGPSHRRVRPGWPGLRLEGRARAPRAACGVGRGLHAARAT
jgi:UDP-N-acetylmuramoylalanine-D-glutamate ligase